MTKPGTPKPRAEEASQSWIGALYARASAPLASRARFIRRLRENLTVAVVIVAVSLAIGMLGYSYFDGLSPIDAFLNAAMILSGMGPVDMMQGKPWSAKLFAGLYALYSGLMLVATAGLILAPILHRFLHRFHLEDTSDEG